MRTIAITNDRYDYHRLYAVMVFPEDNVFRASYLRMLVEQGRMAADDSVKNLVSWDAPRWEEIKARAQRSIRSGILAGDYLAIWSMMDARGMRDPSSRRASQAVERFRRGAQYKDGVPFRATSRKVEGTDFAAHRNSAHLWAALQIFRVKHGEGARQQMHRSSGLRWFLRVAKYIQEFGLSQVTPRTNENKRHFLLDPEEVWRVPANISPAKPKDLPQFNPRMKEILGTYEPY